MNKFKKIILSILGGANIGFSIFTPLGLSLLIFNQFGSTYSSMLLLACGIMSSGYRAIMHLAFNKN